MDIPQEETNRYTVLSVDDDEMVLRSLKRLLRNEPYELVCRPSAREGLKLLEERPVSLILSDQRMPEMEGIEFLRIVREKYPDTIRIILSGYTRVDALENAINEGHIYKFIAKPWNDQDLKRVIREGLEYYDLRMQNKSLSWMVIQQNESLKRLSADLEQTVSERSRTLALFQDILEELPCPVIGLDEQGRISMINRAAEGMFAGARTHLMLGATLREAGAVNVRDVETGGRTDVIELTLPDGNAVRMKVRGASHGGGSILVAEAFGVRCGHAP